MFFVAVTIVGDSVTRVLAQPPSQDIYIAPFAKGTHHVTLGEITNITDRVGYDNQPCFAPGASYVMYVSYVDGQADIFRYDIAAGKMTQITDTPESEYSPTIVDAGAAFTSVRVEADSTQRLWRFNIDGSDPTPVLTDVVSVGYHAWLTGETVALFIVGEPHMLDVANTQTQKSSQIAVDIGRALHRIPGTESLSFTRQVSDGDWWFYRYDPGLEQAEKLVPLLKDSQDCTWTLDGEILMARSDSLFMINPAGDRKWRNVAVLGDRGISAISRLALSQGNEYIAIVAADNQAKESSGNE